MHRHDVELRMLLIVPSYILPRQCCHDLRDAQCDSTHCNGITAPDAPFTCGDCGVDDGE